MKKIPTLFVRDEDDRQFVTRELNPTCAWVAAESERGLRGPLNDRVLWYGTNTPGRPVRTPWQDRLYE
ncbi:hypothetical protein [Streptomyces sp. NPDC055912]|uniref:hypothetical protein n=1 Tax=Streptomyces sp. NPDC055912 TaxID=3345660 RepID=UPI0035D8238B